MKCTPSEDKVIRSAAVESCGGTSRYEYCHVESIHDYFLSQSTPHFLSFQMACSGSPSREDASVLDQILKNTGLKLFNELIHGVFSPVHNIDQ